MLSWLPIFAQDPGTPVGPPMWTNVILFAFVGFMFFMFMRASSRQRKELQKTLSALKKNDEVVTSGGLIGIVVSIKENADEVTLKFDDSTNSRVRVLKSSIVRVNSPGAAEPAK